MRFIEWISRRFPCSFIRPVAGVKEKAAKSDSFPDRIVEKLTDGGHI
jgi:hypothetical protein